MVQLLHSNTIVLMPPITQFNRAGFLERFAVLQVINTQADKQRAEKHHFGCQKHPHRGRGHVRLLLQISELLSQSVSPQHRLVQHLSFACRECRRFKAHFALSPNDIRTAHGR